MFRYKTTILLTLVFMVFFLSSHATASRVCGVVSSKLSPNQFSLILPAGLGGDTLTMQVQYGSFCLELDGGAGTAELLFWEQWVSGITIQGKKSGVIKISLDPSQPSTGTYLPGPNAFILTTYKKVEFDDSELSAIGFTSPFYLTSQEPGTIVGDTISFVSVGTGDVSGETFEYACFTTAKYVGSSVPTLTQYGLIILLVVLAGVATWVVIKKRRVVAA